MGNDLRLVLAQIGEEQRSFWRNRTRAVFGFFMPIAFLVLLAAANHGSRLHDGTRYVAFLVPGMLAWGVIATTFTNLSVSTAVLRDTGVLKRLRGTPLPQWVWLAGRIGSSVISAAAMVAVVLTIGAVGYGVGVPVSTIPGLAVALVAGTICFSALGIGIARLIPNADAAPAVATGLVLPLLFISAVFSPADGLPAWLSRLADVFPVKALADAVHVAFSATTTGPGLAGHDLLLLGVWSVVGVRLLSRFLQHEVAQA